ncbi:NAD(P)H-dependent oxidoreductase [Lujinxingia vulgaris]|uniref:NAD(P)H-dependent oxidoreductase n=1 Tax=Lujinxingia vulgaris TaxID=2600176 RepID=A0A5C6X9L8_9DELT|nr:NAD(P)H-dependent oxidoreductase [Lujinxingia vulgaris]TXD38066.1 NAD(P)H-dependent oxidoreductase [Lujinxingia vulgaris]
MRDILVLDAHPDPSPERFGHALAQAYAEEIRDGGAPVRVLRLSDLTFDPVLRDGIDTPQPWEPDLHAAMEAIAGARWVTLVFPTWWAGPPALLKGFIDRVMLPHVAYRHEGKALPTGLLAGRGARIVTTMDAPSWWYTLAHRRSVHASLIQGTLRYVGFGPVRETTVYTLRELSEAQREQKLRQVRSAARKDLARASRCQPVHDQVLADALARRAPGGSAAVMIEQVGGA